MSGNCRITAIYCVYSIATDAEKRIVANETEFSRHIAQSFPLSIEKCLLIRTLILLYNLLIIIVPISANSTVQMRLFLAKYLRLPLSVQFLLILLDEKKTQMILLLH